MGSCVVHHSHSPHSAVRKKDNSWRTCIDYSGLNHITVKDKFPMPIIKELFEELHGAAMFTKLDLRDDYHQIKMDPRDIHKTVFKSYMGHYEYLVIPFGMVNEPSTFHHLMNMIFKPYLREFDPVFFL